jgi:hypothetical protein
MNYSSIVVMSRPCAAVEGLKLLCKSMGTLKFIHFIPNSLTILILLTSPQRGKCICTISTATHPYQTNWQRWTMVCVWSKRILSASAMGRSNAGPTTISPS